MRRPFVTIVTPSFNQGRFIRQTIESVLAQDYPNLEYIIIDGGSTDETASVAAEYAGQLTFISEPDRGQSHAINKGFRLARGDVVSWLNSDDIILPGAVAHAVSAFERDPTLGAVYGEGYLINYDGAVTSRFPATEPFNLWKLIYVSDYILQQTTYFRRSVLDDVGFLNEDLHWGLDWDFLIRIGKRYWIEYIPQYMGSLREYDAAKTFSGGRRRFRELTAIMRAHSHKRFPPGYVTYGLDTYQRILGRYLPFASWRNALTRKAHRTISRVLNESQGVYPDGWAAGRVKWMFPAGRGRARLHGMLPGFPQLAEQSLEVFCNGAFAGQFGLGFGDFAIEFDYEGPDDRSPSFIEVRASKTLVPKEHAMGDDGRPLAYHFGRFERLR